MTTYDPGVFAALYQTKTGQGMWAFLTDPETITRMETATALGRPAVEGIEEPLLSKFGEAVLADRTKQMCGHMVRQIMERRGYIIAQQNVKITNGAPFSRATRYKKADAMTFHVYRNSKDPRQLALTADKSGSHLLTGAPHKGAKWTYWKNFEGGLRGRIAFGLENEKQAREDIAEKGYHVYRMERLLRAAR